VNLKLDENLGHMAAELFRQAGHGWKWTVQRGRIREYRPDRPEEEREDA
jgi:hypothetical protein